MILYLPRVFCARCDKVAETMRMSDGKTRWVRARCHGQEEKVPLTPTPDQQVTLWQPVSDPSPSSN